MRLVDLFCGRGGWSIPFLAAGWDCVGLDKVRLGYPGDFVERELPVSADRVWSMRPDLVVASPPCEDFARLHLPWIKAKPDIGSAVALLEWAISLRGKVGCPVVVECSRFAAMHVPGARIVGSYALWGDVDGPWPPVPRRKQKRSGLRPDLRAMIEPALSNWLLARASPLICSVA